MVLSPGRSRPHAVHISLEGGELSPKSACFFRKRFRAAPRHRVLAQPKRRAYNLTVVTTNSSLLGASRRGPSLFFLLRSSRQCCPPDGNSGASFSSNALSNVPPLYEFSPSVDAYLPRFLGCSLSLSPSPSASSIHEWRRQRDSRRRARGQRGVRMKRGRRRGNEIEEESRERERWTRREVE